VDYKACGSKLVTQSGSAVVCDDEGVVVAVGLSCCSSSQRREAQINERDLPVPELNRLIYPNIF